MANNSANNEGTAPGVDLLVISPPGFVPEGASPSTRPAQTSTLGLAPTLAHGRSAPRPMRMSHTEAFALGESAPGLVRVSHIEESVPNESVLQ
jgi:hypothetical protein